MFALALASCGGARVARGSGEEQAALRVANHHWLDVVIYVTHGGRRTRLGEVVAAGERRYGLGARLLEVEARSG